MNEHDRCDFTEIRYREILMEAKTYYKFAQFNDNLGGDDPLLLWRHDVDASIHRALALAKIENELGVASTYFIHLHSSFYNTFENVIAQKIREIIELGHEIGLHFDPSAFSGGNVGWNKKIAWEKNILEEFFDVEIGAISWHNPEFGDWLSVDEHEICGMVNAYSREIKAKFGYVSDSNGYWRFERMPSLIKSRKYQKLQVLTHPASWVHEPIAPRRRILRCIEGRAKSVMNDYDNIMLTSGRLNIDD